MNGSWHSVFIFALSVLMLWGPVLLLITCLGCSYWGTHALLQLESQPQKPQPFILLDTYTRSLQSVGWLCVVLGAFIFLFGVCLMGVLRLL
jgi:hypothetical protein